MNYLKLLTAAALFTAALPLAANAQGRGPGSCTPPLGVAVGAAGRAMNGGQLMAGVGQCAPVRGWHNTGGYGFGVGYGQPLAVQPSVAPYDYGETGGYPY
jgi:hypothetical protein